MNEIHPIMRDALENGLAIAATMQSEIRRTPYREGVWIENTNEIWISGYGRYATAPDIIRATERLGLLKRAGVITHAFRGATWTNELWPMNIESKATNQGGAL